MAHGGGNNGFGGENEQSTGRGTRRSLRAEFNRCDSEGGQEDWGLDMDGYPIDPGERARVPLFRNNRERREFEREWYDRKLFGNGRGLHAMLEDNTDEETTTRESSPDLFAVRQEGINAVVRGVNSTMGMNRKNTGGGSGGRADRVPVGIAIGNGDPLMGDSLITNAGNNNTNNDGNNAAFTIMLTNVSAEIFSHAVGLRVFTKLAAW